MSEDNQFIVPPSFIELFIEPGRHKPSASREHITQRYEVCEDLAAALTERAGTLQWQLGIAERDVLERVHAGLQEPSSGLTEAEALWVTRRLAELMEW
jgi:hypothetical protein